MQLKWTSFNSDYSAKIEVFNCVFIIRPSFPWSPIEWEIVRSDLFPTEPLRDGFKTKEEAMVAAHQIIEKELEKGYVGKAAFDSLPAKLSYIPEDMFGCKKALALFTNENGDEYIDSALISATIPKGSLVREADPEHHNDLTDNGICRKCRSDRAIIVDILEPENLPSRKTQRKKIPIISVYTVTLALRMYFTAQGSIYGLTARRMQYRDECTIMRKLLEGFLSTACGFGGNAREFGQWLRRILDPGFPISLDLAIVARLMEPYKDIMERYQDDSYMLCKVLSAKMLRDIGIMDIALRQSYKIGDRIQIDDFDLSNNACGAGFHFFKTAIEAWNYKFN